MIPPVDDLTRFRCYSKCLLRWSDLINPRWSDNDAKRGVFVTGSGPCPKCAAGGHIVYNEFGPADRVNHYTRVGIKIGRPSTAPCDERCTGATTVECKCSCGGSNHGIAG